MRKYHNILVTGGCGFIGSNFIRYLMEDIKFDGVIHNLDKLTYAGKRENISDLEGPGLRFYPGDVCNKDLMKILVQEYKIDLVINFAAESFVDKAIENPEEFLQTNIFGPFSLMEAIKSQNSDAVFYQISTDEVYGQALGDTKFIEDLPFNPRNPYAASKAGADLLVNAYHTTYNLPTLISHCSNNYGPYQFPEKLIPLMISNIVNNKPLPVYGEGKQIRDWLYVKDHCSAIWKISTSGTFGETYNIGGGVELTNINLVENLCERMGKILNKDVTDLITFVKDRLGHDFRYAIDFTKLSTELDWFPEYFFEDGINKTIDWYLSNKDWLAH